MSLFGSVKRAAASLKLFSEIPALIPVSEEIGAMARNKPGYAKRLLSMGAAGDKEILAELEFVIGDKNKARLVYDELRALRPGMFTEQEKEHLIAYLESNELRQGYDPTLSRYGSILSKMLGTATGGPIRRGLLKTAGVDAVGLLGLDAFAMVKTIGAISSAGLWGVAATGGAAIATGAMTLRALGGPYSGLFGTLAGLNELGRIAKNPAVALTMAYPAAALRGIDLSKLHNKDMQQNPQLDMHYQLQAKRGF